jgi:hypothetical protein
MFKKAMHFSKLVLFFNIFRITPFINTALYLANIGALFGSILLLTMNPGFPYVNFNSWLPLSNEVFNAILIAAHAAPVYAFRARQTVQETFSLDVILTIGVAFMAYLTMFYRDMPLLYGLKADIIVKMFVFTFLMFLGVHVIFFWK